MNALMLATSYGYVDIVKYLIENETCSYSSHELYDVDQVISSILWRIIIIFLDDIFCFAIESNEYFNDSLFRESFVDCSIFY